MLRCVKCQQPRRIGDKLLSDRCIHCGGAFFDDKVTDNSYNATKHWQEGSIEMVEDALVRAGIKYIRVYFDDRGTLQIEKERE
jgi:predicted  nucleic acid-binding Zn-ribbon protein